MKRYLVLLALIGITHSLFASTLLVEGEEIQMGRESHGGDRIGLEFIASARAGIHALAEMKLQIPVQKMTATLERSLIASTEEDLLIDRNNNKQTSTAINFYNEKNVPVIRINSTKWDKLSSDNKKALAVHELLCLLKLEKTYDYRYSSYLSKEILTNQLATNGLECKSDFSKLTEKQLAYLQGNFQLEGSPVFLKIFYDYRSNKMKYLHEIKNQMIGTFTTSETMIYCKKEKGANLYFPTAGGLITFNVDENQLQSELSGPDSDGPIQIFNKLED